MQKEKKLVSVIMPVYNGENYVERGIKSVINQTYDWLELIVVNDGSSDCSEKVIKKYLCNTYEAVIRINYIKQANKGVAEARNTGLRCAAGTYVMFIDQDDWMESDCIEKMILEAERSDADVVISGFKLVNKDESIKEVWKLNADCEWSKFRIVAPWAKIYRREVIEQFNIYFLNTKISEDLYFNILFFSVTNRIRVIANVGYNWLLNEKSESRMNWNKISTERNPIFVLEQLQNKIKDSQYLKEEQLTYFFSKYLIWYLLYNAGENDKENLLQMYAECFQWLDDNYPLYHKWKVTGIHVPKGEQFKIRLCVTGSIFLHKLKLLPVALLVYSRMKR